MSYIIDHDLHVHSGGSICSGDPDQTPQRILQYAADNGYTTVCLTDHFWDEEIPIPAGGWAAGFYAPQNYPHLCKNLPLPQQEGIRFLFGAEAEMTLDGTVGLTPERCADFDFVLISISHFHMTDFAISAADAATPAGRAAALLNKLERVLSLPLPWHKIGLSHLAGPKLGGGDPANHIAVLQLAQGERLTALLKKAAALGVGIELNTATFGFANEEEEQAVVEFYAHAKDCGCKFFFGSDAHSAPHFAHHSPRAQRMADRLGLEEKDIFRI